jgi:hypothetical protein
VTVNIHLDELGMAREYTRGHAFEDLSSEQTRLILDRGRELYKWFKAHPRTHALINALVILSLFAFDFVALLQLPHWILPSGGHPSVGLVAVAAIISGSLHSWFTYSIGIFSLHEGAAHKLIFPGKGRLSRAGQFLAANLCRLSATEPDYYAACHMAHHAKFGTEQDSEFLNFVRPRRFWPTLLPLASFVNYSDFVAHRPLHYTRGRVISALIGVLYNGIYAYLLFRRFGGVFTLIVLALTPHLGFYMDRLRQFTEHNLMPLENKSGTRSFGAGFFALLIGGGPWGQPCHMAHHLVASIPWYQQIVLHRFIVKLLTERQKQQFLLPPGLGFPRLLWRVVRDANAFSRTTGRTT